MYILTKKTDFNDFLSRKEKRLENLSNATKESKKDILKGLKKFLRSPSIKSYLLLNRSFINSATWLGKSTIRLIKPFEPSFNDKLAYLRSEEAQYILRRVKDKKSISYIKASYNEIFKTILYDFEISHLDKSYKRVSQVPQIESSVLLVSGVLNEIFTTPAFDRGAKYLKEKYNIHYNYCPTSGTKSTSENSKMIKNHMETLLKENESVFVFAYSKGGIDFLHFLKEHGLHYGQYIKGLSTVAAPILGSERVNHKLLKFLNQLHRLETSKIYRLLDQNFDILFKEFQKSLSSEFQENWFQENYSYLPNNIFYTALALESHWYDSHAWMILTKLFFQSESINDGIVDADRALYPDYFNGINLGIINGHHLIGTRSSDFVQEALIEAHIVFLNYLGLLN